jgi:hypothetical protein
MTPSADEQIRPVPWPKDDEIRWVQWRVWEREAIEAGKSPAWDKKGKYSLTEYRAWLLHERDHRSFQQIGELLFANCGGPENLKRRAYLAYNRVESEFRRGALKRTAKAPDFVITAYGVNPDRENRATFDEVLTSTILSLVAKKHNVAAPEAAT